MKEKKEKDVNFRVFFFSFMFYICFVCSKTVPITLNKASLAFIFTLKYFIYLTLGQLSKKMQRIIAIIFLSISLNMCFAFSKEPSQ